MGTSNADSITSGRNTVIRHTLIVPGLLEDGVPVVVGTTAALGSPYKNHWLVVYQYAFDSTGKLWYKAYDNHGSITTIIPAVQTLCALWLEKL